MYSEKVKRLLERLDQAVFLERDEVILELGRLKTEEALQALLELSEQTTHIADLYSIVRAIGLFRSPVIVEPLLELWRKHSAEYLRAEIIQALDRIDYPGVFELIEQEFLNVSAKSFRDSERLIDILCRRGDARSIALLLEGFDHLASRVTASDISLTERIVLEGRLMPFLRALGKLRVRESWSRIKDLLFEDVSDQLRRVAIQAMMRIDPQRTAPLLFDLTRNKNISFHFRKTIYDAIG